MRWLRSWHSRALAGYGALAVMFSWPLPARLATHLFGSPRGDMGVYLWNLWVFRHELVDQRHLPFFTSTIFSLDRQADLSLHNYTVFADVLALPLLPLVGVVAAFNLVYLAMVVLNGYALFLLARRMGAGNLEAWLGGALFAFAPCLVARSTGHLSLVMAAPLVVFLLVLHRMDAKITGGLAVAAGAVVAWATFCDPYYGVYCVALCAWHLAWRHLEVRVAPLSSDNSSAVSHRAASVLDVAIALVSILIAWIAVTGGWSGVLFGQVLSMRTLFTPVLALTLLLLARLALWLRPSLRMRALPGDVRLLRVAPYSALSGCALMAPLLYALGTRIADGRYVAAGAYWRSSMPGIDLLSFVLPNPNNPLLASLGRAWVSSQPGGYIENVASLTFAALFVIAVAVLWARYRLPRYWAALAIVSASLALGPFISVGGVFTYVPTPWAILRYAPILGGARAPARFMAIVMIAVAILFALALTAIRRRFSSPRARGLVVAGAAALLLFELFPAPRDLYQAKVPDFYHRIAADPRDVRVLELPFGVRDGLSSVGDFNASSQFFQTVHRKRLIGGYLSRVSAQRVRDIRRRPILNALIELSEGRPLPPGSEDLKALGPSFVQRARVGYVVVDRTRASAELIRFAVETLQLEKIAGSTNRDLYRPRMLDAKAGL